MKRLVGALVLSMGLLSAETPVLTAARQAQTAAEAALQAQRNSQRAALEALRTRITTAQEGLAAARRAQAAQQAERQRLEEEQAARQRAAARTEHELQIAVNHLLRLVGSAAPRELHAAEVAAQEAQLLAQFHARLAALRAACTVHRQPAVTLFDRAGHQFTADQLTLGALASYAVAADDTHCGRLGGDASTLLIDPADPAHATALRAAWRGETVATLALDVSQQLDRVGVVTRPDWQSWLQAGGPFVWPIVAIGALALLLIGERLVASALRRAPRNLTARILTTLRQQGPAAARAQLLEAHHPTARILRAGLSAWEADAAQREEHIEAALIHEEIQLGRSLRLLGVLAAAAPLLGLLGTVSGMITTFDVIAVHGTGNPQLLSGGISQALITTQLGLVVAVPALVAHAWLGRLAERHYASFEQAAHQLLAIDKELHRA